MNIVPFASENHFQISKESAKDESISLGAKGLLFYGLAAQRDFEGRMTRRILEEAHPKNSPNSIKTWMRELESLGYIQYFISGKSGAAVTTVTFLDAPVPLEQRTDRTNWREKLPLAQ
jgi:hypothetical protein